MSLLLLIRIDKIGSIGSLWKRSTTTYAPMTKPEVLIIVATSVDGFIAQSRLQASVDWTSSEDKKHFHQVTKQAGVVVMGEATLETINLNYLPFSERLNIIYSHKTRQELVAKLDLNQEKINDASLRVTSLPPLALVEELREAGFSQVAICGGRSIYTQFMQAGVVDRLLITVEPVIFGDGIKFFGQEMMANLRLLSSKKLNERGTLLQEYAVEEAVKQAQE